MAIVHKGKKLSAKEKATVLIKEYIEDFDLEIEIEDEKLTNKELIHIQDQVDKILPRVLNPLLTPEEREKLKEKKKSLKDG